MRAESVPLCSWQDSPSNSMVVQVDIHAPWGGVVPKLAQEAHERAMESTVQAALREACISQDQLEGVAVTIGPGLSLCLQVQTFPCKRWTSRAT